MHSLYHTLFHVWYFVLCLFIITYLYLVLLPMLAGTHLKKRFIISMGANTSMGGDKKKSLTCMSILPFHYVSF